VHITIMPMFILGNISELAFMFLTAYREIRTFLSSDISQLVKFAGSDNSQFVDFQGRTFLSHLFCRVGQFSVGTFLS